MGRSDALLRAVVSTASLQGMAPSWTQGFLNTVSVTGCGHNVQRLHLLWLLPLCGLTSAAAAVPPPPPKKTTHPPPPTHPPTHTWLCRLMDSLEIFTQVPVDPDSYYLVGLQVYGVPGFDFLSPIGTSGVTIAAALNPCVGG